MTDQDQPHQVIEEDTSPNAILELAHGKVGEAYRVAQQLRGRVRNYGVHMGSGTVARTIQIEYYDPGPLVGDERWEDLLERIDAFWRNRDA